MSRRDAVSSDFQSFLDKYCVPLLRLCTQTAQDGAFNTDDTSSFSNLESFLLHQQQSESSESRNDTFAADVVDHVQGTTSKTWKGFLGDVVSKHIDYILHPLILFLPKTENEDCLLVQVNELPIIPRQIKQIYHSLRCVLALLSVCGIDCFLYGAIEDRHLHGTTNPSAKEVSSRALDLMTSCFLLLRCIGAGRSAEKYSTVSEELDSLLDVITLMSMDILHLLHQFDSVNRLLNESNSDGVYSNHDNSFLLDKKSVKADLATVHVEDFVADALLHSMKSASGYLGLCLPQFILGRFTCQERVMSLHGKESVSHLSRNEMGVDTCHRNTHDAASHTSSDVKKVRDMFPMYNNPRSVTEIVSLLLFLSKQLESNPPQVETTRKYAFIPCSFIMALYICQLNLHFPDFITNTFTILQKMNSL